VEAVVDFIRRPSAARWYRAHNASICLAYLANADLAGRVAGVERFFLNVVLLRVLYPPADHGDAAQALLVGRRPARGDKPLAGLSERCLGRLVRVEVLERGASETAGEEDVCASLGAGIKLRPALGFVTRRGSRRSG